MEVEPRRMTVGRGKKHAIHYLPHCQIMALPAITAIRVQNVTWVSGRIQDPHAESKILTCLLTELEIYV